MVIVMVMVMVVMAMKGPTGTPILPIVARTPVPTPIMPRALPNLAVFCEANDDNAPTQSNEEPRKAIA